MKTAEKNILIYLMSVLLVACGGYLPSDRSNWPINSGEMHSWQPPDENVLANRRANQIGLDSLTEEISILFLNHASLSRQELTMLEIISQDDHKIDAMDSAFTQRVESEQERVNRMRKDFELTKSGFLNANARLKKIMEIKPPLLFSTSDYNSAMHSFRDGKFQDSLTLFFKLIKQKPPSFLKDNIQFGVGSAYYRLKNYPQAIKYFQSILDNYAQGDKRFISYFMLGVIHNLQGQKSRALYLLEQALSKNPPEKMRTMINRLINIVNDEPTHAAG
jgi:TolA-binding protein